MTLFKDAGYSFINLDDCWAEKNRTASGDLTPGAIWNQPIYLRMLANIFQIRPNSAKVLIGWQIRFILLVCKLWMDIPMTSLKSIDPLLYSQAGIVRIHPGISPVPLTSSTVSSAVRRFGLVYLCWLPRLLSKRSAGCQGILGLGLRLSEVSNLRPTLPFSK